MTQLPPRTTSLRIVQNDGETNDNLVSARPASTTHGPSKANIDALSDKATTAFIRRTLCPHHALADGGTAQKPIDELLPPLTSSNEVDLQLYALLAIIVKDFVYTWYAKITPDHVFVDEVVQIVAHCTRAIEQRLRKVDLESLILDEIPSLLDAHLAAFRSAHRPFYSSPLASTPRQIYHSLIPQPALSPVPREDQPDSVVEQERNEEVWRQLLVQGVLAVLLPTEDLENGCLRALVGEIFSELIVRGALADRICESWMLWEIIIRVLEIIKPRSGVAVIAQQHGSSASPTASRLEQFGLLANVDDAALDSRTTHPSKKSEGSRSRRITVSGVFWAGVQYAFLAVSAARILVLALASSPSLPSRFKTWPLTPSESVIRQGAASDTKRPLVSVAVWRMSARLIQLDLRMPWLSGLLSLVHHTLLRGPAQVDGRFDRILSHHISTRLLSPKHLPHLLRALRAALFPNNALAPPRQVPDPEQVVAIKRRCAEAIIDALPVGIAVRYFAAASPSGKQSKGEPREQMLQQAESLLDVFGDAYMNKHLAFGVLELLIVRLVPEMAEKGVRELIGERLGDGD